MTTETTCQVNIRLILRMDMDEVLNIEQLSFPYPWTEECLLRCLREHETMGLVAEDGDKVVGYMVFELLPKKLHVLNFAVHPSWSRRGVGTQMVERLVSKLARSRRTRITLDVRETNLAAQLFFKAQGFVAVKTLPGFYLDSGEDAYRMCYRLEEAKA